MTDLLDIGAYTWPSMVGQVVWQSTAVLALGLLVSRIVTMRPSRAHRILFTAAVVCLIAPLASLLVRRLDLGFFPPRVDRTARGQGSAGPRVTAAVPRTVSESPAQVGAPRPEPNETRAADPVPRSGPSASGIVTSRYSLSNAAAALRVFRANSLTGSLVIVWAAVTAGGLLRLLVSFVIGTRLNARASRVCDRELVEVARAASKSLGLRAVPELRASRWVRCPVVWCWGRRPVLILPENLVASNPRVSASWSAVLCHELAHWRRGDHFSALLGELLTCLLPWQPLAWIVRKRMADLAELSCDDWALTHATAVSPPDYAEALLNLVADRRRPLVPAAVSRRSGVGARVRHILEEAPRMPRTGYVWSALTVALAGMLVMTLALAQTKQARAIASQKPGADGADDTSAPRAKQTTVTGIARGPNGATLEGVDFYWITADPTTLAHVTVPPDHPDYGIRRMKILARAQSTASGRFAMSAAVDQPLRGENWSMVVASKAGFAPESAMVAPDEKPLEFQLQPPVRIIGRLLTPGGDPAAGVSIELEEFSSGAWRDVRTAKFVQFGPDTLWNPRPPFAPGKFVTDKAGRFTIDGFVPAGVFAKLIVTHSDYAVEELTVATGENTEPTPELAAFSVRPLARTFTHTLIPARPVVGQITDGETKQPIAGVTVSVTPMRRHGGTAVRTVTDKTGRFRVADRDAETYWVTAFPPADSGYLPAQRGMMKWRAGERELQVDLALRRGVIVRGRVVDADSGEPIANAGVIYQPTRGNSHVQEGDDSRRPVLTGSDGRFALTGLRGPGIVAAEAPSDQYIRHRVDPVDFGYTSSVHVHGIARLTVPVTGESPEVLLKLKKGITLEARAVAPDGSSIDVFHAWCPELAAKLIDNWVSLSEFESGLFRLHGAEPGRTYRVFFLSMDQKFGTVAELQADPERKRPIEVKFEPTAAMHGRVLDHDGMPLEGAQILPNIQLIDKGPDLTERDRFDHFVTEVYVQFSGEPLKQVYPAEFRYTGLIPGVRYFVTWYTREGGHSWRAVEALKPGEDRNVGDLRSKKQGG